MDDLFAADIETESLPDDKLLRLYDPPERVEKFDEEAVDVGRATKAETIARKMLEARALYDAAMLDWPEYCERRKAEWLAATKRKAALSPLTGRVLTIAWGDSGNVTVAYDNSEAGNIDAWWRVCESQQRCGRRIVFHNGFNFDLPLLVRLSWLLDVTVPDWVMSVRGSRVYFNQDVFLDTLVAWGAGRPYKFVSLDNLARAFGFEGKSEGCDGADFARMWHGTPEERELALEYAKQDVRVTYRIAQAMGLG